MDKNTLISVAVMVALPLSYVALTKVLDRFVFRKWEQDLKDVEGAMNLQQEDDEIEQAFLNLRRQF